MNVVESRHPNAFVGGPASSQLRFGSVVPTFRTNIDEAWPPLPFWAQSFFELGAALTLRASSSPLVLAVAVPVRAYAAVAVAGGCVLGAIKGGLADERETGSLDVLRSLVAGTAITVTRDEKRQPATFLESVEKEGGRRFLKVSYLTKSGRETYTFPETESWRISLAPSEQAQGMAAMRRRSVFPRRAFLSAVLGPSGLTRLSRRSDVGCVMVGRQSLLRSEAAELRLGVPVGERKLAVARAADLLRVRRWVARGAPFASDVVAASNGQLRGESAQRPLPRTIVFDGAIPFLKWRHDWPDAHWIVLLDRTDSHCDSAAAEVRSLYARRGRVLTDELASERQRDELDLIAFERHK